MSNGPDEWRATRAVFAEFDGWSSRAIAAELNARGISAPAGGQWSSPQVLRIQHQLGIPTGQRPKVTRPYPSRVAAHAYAESLRPLFAELASLSTHKLAAELNARKVPTASGKGKWSASLVVRVEERLGRPELDLKGDLPPLTRAWAAT
jgi:hypothetical protein